jgi:hypothetical protein
MAVDRMKLQDWFNVVNALTDGATDGPPVPATTSFVVDWSGNLGTEHISDDENDFTADLIQDIATMKWRVWSRGKRYHSVGESENVFSEIGRELSGVFNT